MYDPSVGRWLEKDPSGFAGRDMNLYRYVGNDPVNNVDPSGREIKRFAIKNALAGKIKDGRVTIYTRADAKSVAVPGIAAKAITREGVLIRYQGPNADKVKFLQFGFTFGTILKKGGAVRIKGIARSANGEFALTTDLAKPNWQVDAYALNPLKERIAYYVDSGGTGGKSADCRDTWMYDRPAVAVGVVKDAMRKAKKDGTEGDITAGIYAYDVFRTYLVIDGKAFARVDWSGKAVWYKKEDQKVGAAALASINEDDICSIIDLGERLNNLAEPQTNTPLSTFIKLIKTQLYYGSQKGSRKGPRFNPDVQWLTE
jgi:hypothetical protein